MSVVSKIQDNDALRKDVERAIHATNTMKVWWLEARAYFKGKQGQRFCLWSPGAVDDQPSLR